MSGAEVSIDGYKKPTKADVLGALFGCSVIFLCIGIGVLHEQSKKKMGKMSIPVFHLEKIAMAPSTREAITQALAVVEGALAVAVVEGAGNEFFY